MIRLPKSQEELTDPSAPITNNPGAPAPITKVPNGDLPDPTLIAPPPPNIETNPINPPQIADETNFTVPEVTPADSSSVTPSVTNPITPPTTATQIPETIITEPVDTPVPIVDTPPPTAIVEPIDTPPPPPVDQPVAPPDKAIVEPVDVPPPPPEVAVETNQQGSNEPAFDMTALMGLLEQFGSTGPEMDVIDPMADLRNTIITGEPSGRTTAARDATDEAANALTTDATGLAADQTSAAEKALGVSPDKVAAANAGVSTAFSNLSSTDRQALVDKLIGQYQDKMAPDARLSKLRGQVDSATDDLAGVDRYKLALDRFNTFSEDTDPAFQKTLRDIMERETAAGGFTGRINTSFGDAGFQREQSLRTERSRLLQQALDDSVRDAMGKQSALAGLEGQLSGEDLRRFQTAAGLGVDNANADLGQLDSLVSHARGIAGDATAAENAALGTGTTRAGQQLDNERSNVSIRSGLESQSGADDLAEANALRGERNYEVGAEDSAYERALMKHRQEQADMMAAFDRQMSLLGAGESGNPSSQIGALATMINPALDMATIAQLASSMGNANGSAGGPAGTDWMSIIESLLKGSTPVPKPTSTNVPSTLPG